MHPTRIMVFALFCAVLFGCQGIPAAGTPATQLGYVRYKDPTTIYKLIQEKTELYILVDVRTPKEYAEEGHIPTAINIPYDLIGDRAPSPNKAELIILYCKTGARSAAAKETLDDMGYTRVVDFGSITRWSWDLPKTYYPSGGCTCRSVGSSSERAE